MRGRGRCRLRRARRPARCKHTCRHGLRAALQRARCGRPRKKRRAAHFVNVNTFFQWLFQPTGPIALRASWCLSVSPRRGMI